MTSKEGAVKEGRWEKGLNVEWFAPGVNASNLGGMNPSNTMGGNNLNPTNTMGGPVHNPANYLPNYNSNGTAPANNMPMNMTNAQGFNNSSLSGFNPTAGTNTMGGMNPTNTMGGMNSTNNMGGMNQSMIPNNMGGMNQSMMPNNMREMNPSNTMGGVNQSMMPSNNQMAMNMAANKMTADNYNNNAGKIGSNVIGGTGSR